MTDFDAVWSGSSRPARLYPTFTGSGAEYFRIWSVNALLTLLTLGVYLAWAKVRKRRYFYWNTFLGGAHFDYLAKPGAILVGHLAVAAAILAAKFSEYLSSGVGGAASVLLYGLIPWLVYKAHRFRARSSAYRGVRFRFLGTVGEAYRVYGLLPGVYVAIIALLLVWTMLSGEEADPALIGYVSLPVGLTAMLLYPYWMYLRRRYTFANVAFGSGRASFSASPGHFYRVYLKAMGLALGAGIAAFFAFFLLSGSIALIPWSPDFNFALLPLFFLAAASVWFAFDQYVYARITNHCWNNLRIGSLSFEVSIDPAHLIWLKISNAAATVATLGLLAPWAEVRRYKYLTECFCVLAPEGFDLFAQEAGGEDSAIGDTAVDFIDLDVGW